jgi:dephospho-CoA kinase
MRIVGLTGGIATGKSTVCKMFGKLGAAIVDADTIAHQAVASGSPAWQEIVAWFGREILQPDGQIDRKKLGSLIFEDAGQRAALNRIVHPVVFAQMDRQVRQLDAAGACKLVLLDIPLLFESGMHEQIRPIIVVYLSPSLQLQRLMARDGISQADALARIRSQLPIESKKDLADHVIDNGQDRRHTLAQTQSLYQTLISAYSA